MFLATHVTKENCSCPEISVFCGKTQFISTKKLVFSQCSVLAEMQLHRPARGAECEFKKMAFLYFDLYGL